MNTVTNSAVAQINDARQANVVGDATLLIGRIQNEQSLVVSLNAQIKAQQDSLAKLAQDTITQQSVMGTQFTGDLNPNQATIAKAIAKLNDDRQASVNATATSITSCITSKQAQVKQANERIATLREELGNLAVDVLTVEQVVG